MAGALAQARFPVGGSTNLSGTEMRAPHPVHFARKPAASTSATLFHVRQGNSCLSSSMTITRTLWHWKRAPSSPLSGGASGSESP